jgi:hypothetical protein
VFPFGLEVIDDSVSFMFSDSSLPRLEEVALDEKKFEVKEYSPLNGNPLVRFSLEINIFHRPTKGISVVGISE